MIITPSVAVQKKSPEDNRHFVWKNRGKGKGTTSRQVGVNNLPRVVGIEPR